MRITRLELENFRCFGRAALDLDPATVLVGRNDAGKSTVIDAIRSLYHDTDHLGRRFRWASVTRRAAGTSLESSATKAALAAIDPDDQSEFPPSRVVATLSDFTVAEEQTWEPFLANGQLRIGVSFEARRADPRYFVVIPSRSEELIIGPRPDLEWLDAITVAIFEAGRAVETMELPELEQSWPTGVPPAAPAFPPIKAMPHIAGPESGPAVPDVILGELVRDRLSGSYVDIQKSKGRPPLEALEEWSTLIRTLHATALLAVRDVSDEYAAAVGNYLPDVETARLHISGPPHGALTEIFDSIIGNVEVSLGPMGRQIDVADLGGGSQRAATLATLELFTVERPEHGLVEGAVVCLVEEPEVGMHASAQRTIAAALRGIADSGKQVVAVTHSPTIIDSFPLSSIRTVLAGPESHRIEQPIELSDVARVLGTTPGDALLASRYVVVEGRSDAAILSIWSILNGVDLQKAKVKVVEAGGYARTEFVAKLVRTLLNDTPITVLLDNGRDTAKLSREIQQLFGPAVAVSVLDRSEIEAYFKRQPIAEWLVNGGANSDAVHESLEALNTQSPTKGLLKNLSRRLLGRDYRTVDDGVAIAAAHKESDLAPEIRALLTELVR